MEPTVEELREIFNTITDADTDRMIGILNSRTYENVDDFAIMGRMFTEFTGPCEPMSREDIEREFAVMALMEFRGINNYDDLTEYDRRFGACIYTLALSKMDRYVVAERLDMLFGVSNENL